VSRFLPLLVALLAGCASPSWDLDSIQIADFGVAQGEVTENGSYTFEDLILGAAGTGSITVPGAGANSEQFGASSAAAGVSGSAFGESSSAGGENASAFGKSASAGGYGSLALGTASSAAHAYATALTPASVTTAANQLVAGNVSYPITSAYFGEGVTSASPQDMTWNGTGGSGVDVEAGDVIFAGGRSTGDKDPGELIFQTTTAHGSDAVLQTLSTRLSINESAVTSTLPILLPDGTSGAPSFAFTNDADGTGTGLFRNAANSISFVSNGSAKVVIGATVNTYAAQVVHADLAGSATISEITDSEILDVSGAEVTTGLIPADAYDVHVCVRNTSTISGTTAVSYKVGIQAGDDDAFGTGIVFTDENSTDMSDWTVSAPLAYSSAAREVEVVPNAGTLDTGTIQVVTFYRLMTAQSTD